MRSEFIYRMIVSYGLLTALVCAKDTVTLAGDRSQVTGIVRSIDERGNIEILSELASKPLFLKSESVVRVEYAASKMTSVVPASRIEFSNGDILPVKIESLDERHLTVFSPHAGRLVISRELVDVIRTGSQSSKLIYRGSGGAKEWAHGDGGQMNWKFKGRAMITNGPATASRDLRLPSQFTLRFTLVWAADGAPDFKIYFADPLTTMHEPADRYFLRLADTGLEIVRESSKRERFSTLVSIDRLSMRSRDARLHIEVRFDRDTGRMELLLDNVSVSEFADPVYGIPSGGGMTVISQNIDGFAQEIRDIEVHGKDEPDLRDLIGLGGEKSSDILLSREDDLWSGRLGSIRPINDELTFFFKTSKDQLLIELPEKDVSMVFMSRAKTTLPVAAENRFILRLCHGGLLTVTCCRLSDDVFTASHPLLGCLTLLPGSVSSMERMPTLTD